MIVDSWTISMIIPNSGNYFCFSSIDIKWKINSHVLPGKAFIFFHSLSVLSYTFCASLFIQSKTKKNTTNRKKVKKNSDNFSLLHVCTIKIQYKYSSNQMSLTNNLKKQKKRRKYNTQHWGFKELRENVWKNCF